MAEVFGQEYAPEEIRARVGTMKQVAGWRRGMYTEGKEDGLRFLEMNNGVLDATILESRCMDLSSLHYRGIPLQFSGCNGWVHPAFADAMQQPLHSVNGGMFYTCGLTNVGKKYEEDDFHGQARLIPAEQIIVRAEWKDGSYCLEAEGTMRQNGVLCENLSLKRRYSSAMGSPVISVKDMVTNEGFLPAPFMMMYHVVFGYPLLDKNTQVYLPEAAEEACFHAAEPTPDGRDSKGWLHKTHADAEGRSHYGIYNPDLELGVAVSFNGKNMPYISQWKSMKSGDYAMGLMPSTCAAGGRQKEIDNGTLQYLQPGESKDFELTFTVFEGEKGLELLKKKIESCK